MRGQQNTSTRGRKGRMIPSATPPPPNHQCRSVQVWRLWEGAEDSDSESTSFKTVKIKKKKKSSEISTTHSRHSLLLHARNKRPLRTLQTQAVPCAQPVPETRNCQLHCQRKVWRNAQPRRCQILGYTNGDEQNKIGKLWKNMHHHVKMIDFNQNDLVGFVLTVTYCIWMERL